MFFRRCGGDAGLLGSLSRLKRTLPPGRKPEADGYEVAPVDELLMVRAGSTSVFPVCHEGSRPG